MIKYSSGNDLLYDRVLRTNCYTSILRFDHCSKHVTVDGADILIGLWDTPGQEDYDKYRPHLYPNTVCATHKYFYSDYLKYVHIVLQNMSDK